MDPCRICLKPKPNNFLTNLSSATFQYVSYRHIYSYFGTALEHHKEFPLVICRDCEFQMICAYKFKMKCLEAEIKISLILQSKSQIDKGTEEEVEEDESNRLECLIELNTLSQQQEMEINLISSFINNAPEILSIDDDRGDLNFALNPSGNLIEFNEQFDYDTHVSSRADSLPDLILFGSTAAAASSLAKDSTATCPELINYAEVSPEIQEQPVNEIKCSKCGNKLNDHLSSNARENGEITCDQCKEDDFQTLFLCKEKEMNREEKSVEVKKTLRRARKPRNSAKKLDDSYEECKLCGIYIKSINICRHLELHQNKAANKQYPCHICGKTFAVKYYANDHVKRVHRRLENDVNANEIFPKMKVKCSICEKEVRKYFLDRHMKSHRSKKVENQSFICHLCQKTFISRETIRAHMITVHLKKKRYSCNHCDQKFIHSLTRYRHINKYHLKKTVASCSLCSASFYHKTSLVAHRRKFHPPSITLKCDECNAIYFDRRQLKKHLLVHFKNNFTCEYCGDSFVRRRKLMTHIQMHTGHGGDCICSICGESFDRVFRLEFHMEEMHPGVKAQA
ncbi:zinc finger protein 260-like [Lutzomyia longipalpis]|uniref:zinc finger protein 260-like n=1 Tax=Lutzomyia longipalpis TaxID=7200 RepID=UPI0024845416|nr:zinc finger protein 260-like [Lutzomyia longipalpis]